ncbi:hypothetical protein IS3_0976 [Staphylococcus aureus subsp. aureus IS-3]|nr:hypothetical protein IS3_0976 [Staphylococcus aureus subsp. aureus IS-3]
MIQTQVVTPIHQVIQIPIQRVTQDQTTTQTVIQIAIPSQVLTIM